MKTPAAREGRSTPRDPAALLFSAYHLKLLGVLLMRPERAFHVRELERLTGLSAGTAYRELKRMEHAGLLASHRQGNQLRYRARRDCPLFPELQAIVRKTVGLADMLREALAPLEHRIERAFVFGSMAAGTARSDSDVDLLVVGAPDFAEVVEAVQPAELRLGRAVNALVLTPDEFSRRRAEPGFMARVMDGPRLPLIGGDDDAG